MNATSLDRAALQRMISNGIRENANRASEIRDILIRGDGDPYTFRTIAAVCHDDAIWDAASQVRQVVLLERNPLHREHHSTIVAWIAGGCSDDDVIAESPGHSPFEVAAIRATVRATLDYAKLAGMDGVPALVPDATDVIYGIGRITGEDVRSIMDRISPDDPIEWAQELEIVAAAIRKGAVENV